MSRRVSPQERRLWAAVSATVRPLSHGLEPGLPLPPQAAFAAALAQSDAAAPQTIEPGRKRRLVRERDAVSARVDLHGLTQADARAELQAFVQRAWTQGERAVLVITGKGVLGDGLLRRHAPEWLAEPQVRAAVAGISEAHQKHGGEGALYVALKRRPKR